MQYYLQIQKAVDYIERHLQQEIGIQEIASSASFSPFHFQRLFLAISGFTVQEYIRKRRLTEASKLLLDSDEGILPIAVAFQYHSQEAFTRAFESYAGMTPGKFRKENAVLTGQPPISFLDYQTKGIEEFEMGKPAIVQLNRTRIIGCEYKTHLDEGRHYRDIPGFYDEFGRNGRYQHIPHRLAPDMAYGVSCRFQDDGGFSFIVGEEAGEFAEVPDSQYVKFELPEGKYAQFKAYGPAEHIQKKRDFIYGVWLPESNYDRREGPDYEVTDVRKSTFPEDMRIKIYIPLV
ncbi:AraC family transcriptional regulator [Paenibacillus sp. URB8-2]|uniref:AraC family transcriptional regulator n=1 Tax=Paenibacillus sp. URB8-2 TaxID=2741301 RepID=UPI0015B7F4F4|nr:AraC family transcriptional regulator [Paenibacillus sp. URB8-2]BCG59043.1 AraC family transcriptional regulator [Paenibacillus sp. URB8-2]